MYFLVDNNHEYSQDIKLPIQSIILNKKDMKSAVVSSKMYPTGYQFEEIPRKYNTKVLVVRGDCLEAAIWLKNVEKTNPCLLNMASTSNPCGGYRNGAGAQEGNFSVRSLWMKILYCRELDKKD
jgi:uncharacterized protein (TIGR02452 family)